MDRNDSVPYTRIASHHPYALKMKVLLEFKAGRLSLQERKLVPDSRKGRVKIVEVCLVFKCVASNTITGSVWNTPSSMGTRNGGRNHDRREYNGHARTSGFSQSVHIHFHFITQLRWDQRRNVFTNSNSKINPAFSSSGNQNRANVFIHFEQDPGKRFESRCNDLCNFQRSDQQTTYVTIFIRRRSSLCNEATTSSGMQSNR